MYESIKKRLTKELEAVKVSGRYKKKELFLQIRTQKSMLITRRS